MINLLREQSIQSIEKQHLIDLEEDVIKTLDFSLRDVSSNLLLDRYLRLVGIDQEQKDQHADQIITLAREFCRYM